MKPKNTLRSFLLGCSSLLAASSLHAAPVTWDITPGTVGAGNGTVTGGAGTWNTDIANGNWTIDAGANNIAWNNGGNDTAIFGGTAGAVVLGDNVIVGGLTFNTNSYSVTPGGFGITFGAPGDINVSTGTTNITAPISGSAITKTGGGALTLSTANTFSGLNLNGGTVNVNGATDSLGAAASTITVLGNSTLQQGGSGAISLNKSLNVSSGTLTFIHGNSSWTIEGVVSGSGTIKVNDAGSDNQRPLGLINAANNFTGAIDLLNNRATIKVASLGDSVGSGNIIFGGNSSLFYLGTEAVASMTLTNRVFEFQGGATTATIENKNTASSSANTLTIDSDLAVTTAGAKTLVLRGANLGNNTFGGDIANGSGTVALTKIDAGKWILGGANTYTGGTSVTGGTLEAGIAGALGTGAVTVTSGTLVIGAANAMSTSAILSLPSATTKNLTMNANQTVAALYLGGAAMPNGTYSAATNASAWMNAGAGILTVGPAAAQPVYWDIDFANPGPGGSAPAETWNGANLFWNNVDGTGSGDFWPAGATAAFAAGTDAIDAYIVNVSGTQDIGGLTFEEGAVTLTGGTALRLVSDSIAFVGSGLTAAVVTPITEDATARSLTKSGSGTLAINGASDFSGLIMNSGPLQVGSTVTLDALTFNDGNNSLSITGGTVSMTGGTITNKNDTSSKTQTITSAVTGSPSVAIACGSPSGGAEQYLKFAPTSGTVALGPVNFYNDGDGGDKGQLQLAGATTGNTVGTVTQAFAYSGIRQDSGEWTFGDVTIGRIWLYGGTMIINGTLSSSYQGRAVFSSGARLGGNLTYSMSASNLGQFVVGSGAIVAPGNPAVASGVGTIHTSYGTGNATVGQTTFDAGSIYEWQVGAANATDVVHVVRTSTVANNNRTLTVGAMTLKILDAGGTPSAGDQLPVFTYDAGVTVDISGFAGSFGPLPPGWSGTPSLGHDTVNRIVYVTGISSGASSPYDTWATGGESFDGDANGDGVKDGLAFLLGAATPSENAIGRLPTVSESGGGLVMTFNCLPVAARGTATLKVSHSNTLAAWTPTVDVVPDADDAVPDNNVTFVVDTVLEAPLNKVTATIGSGAAAAGKLFGRLEGEQP